MMYAGRQMTLATLTLALALACVGALPNHLKAVVVDTDPDPIPVKKTTVSASFGGYSAQAGLGGSDSAGGLFAAAESPHGSASAGLGGSVAGGSPIGSLGASASTGDIDVHNKPIGGHKPVHNGQGLFDNIFNIPISVLQAVNTYLNNRGPVTKPVHRRRGHRRPQHPVVYKTVTPEHTGPGADSPVPEVAVKSGAGAHVYAEGQAGAEAGSHSSNGATGITGANHDQRPVVIQKRVNYDDIFNIPISALKSVNHMLNNGKK